MVIFQALIINVEKEDKMELTKKELIEIDGGVNWYIIGGIGAAITYIIGIISGYTNPSHCNN